MTMTEALTQQQRIAVSMTLWLADRVARAAARCTSRVLLDDLMQIARTALTEAARRFDPSHGTPLEVFAWKAMVGAVTDVLGRKPKRHQRALRAFLTMLEVPASSGDVADSFHDTDEQVSAEIDERCDDAALVLFLALTADDWQSQGEAGYIRRETSVNAKHLVRAALGSLEDAPRRVIHLRYWEERSWPEIAGIMALAKTTVQYHERRARKQLLRYLLAHGLRGDPDHGP